MEYSEYKYMSASGLEADMRKLTAYAKYCKNEEMKAMVRKRVDAIMKELDTRAETELYNYNLPLWKN